MGASHRRLGWVRGAALVVVLLLTGEGRGRAEAEVPVEPASSSAVAGPAREALFRRGNDAYLRGQYDAALAAYEQLVSLGVRSEDLFFNLGNAYAKAGQLGPAIYNYERALAYDPGQEDVLFNLSTAREAVRRQGEDRLVGAEEVSRWIRIVSPFTVSFASWLFLSLWSGLFGLLIVLRFRGEGFLRVGLQALLGFVVLATVGAGGLLAGRLYLATRVLEAVVLPPSIEVRDGPDAASTTSFSVHAGLKLRVIETERDWARVRLANGLEGWVPERTLGRL
jgi:tetratricopeptide (TPR) repeat protein